MLSLHDRFWAKVDAMGDCWEWTGGKQDRRYGIFHPNGSATGEMAHRFAWELLVGPIPDGLTLDHLCRNPSCVNPDHLEPVTIAENLMRGYGLVGKNIRKTHCPQNHAYSGDNLYIDPRGWRKCRTCERARNRERNQNKEPGTCPDCGVVRKRLRAHMALHRASP
jgi:hypothetical protein